MGSEAMLLELGSELEAGGLVGYVPATVQLGYPYGPIK
jgi:hypothetical protein